MSVPPRQRLTAADWTTAALSVLADGGLPAVAVEPLAARLGTTKGSFYYHFANRDALVTAALEQWERVHTDDVIAALDTGPPGLERLRTLLWTAMGGLGDDGPRLEVALQPHAEHPLVAPVLRRVTRRRLDYLTGLFADLGFAPEEAVHRGRVAYTHYLGSALLARTDAAAVTPASLDAALEILTAGR